MDQQGTTLVPVAVGGGFDHLRLVRLRLLSDRSRPSLLALLVPAVSVHLAAVAHQLRSPGLISLRLAVASDLTVRGDEPVLVDLRCFATGAFG